jgi:hypothetical protein
VDIPNDNPFIGETFRTYDALKYVSNDTYRFVDQTDFTKGLKFALSIKSFNGTEETYTTLYFYRFLYQRLTLQGKYLKKTCEEQFLGLLVDDFTCEVYYKLNGICLVFDSLTGNFVTNVGGVCRNYPLFNENPNAQYSLIDIHNGQTLRRVDSFGFIEIRDIHDPYVYVMNLDCNGGFCDSIVGLCLDLIF